MLIQIIMYNTSTNSINQQEFKRENNVQTEPKNQKKFYTWTRTETEHRTNLYALQKEIKEKG